MHASDKLANKGIVHDVDGLEPFGERKSVHSTCALGFFKIPRGGPLPLWKYSVVCCLESFIKVQSSISFVQFHAISCIILLNWRLLLRLVFRGLNVGPESRGDRRNIFSSVGAFYKHVSIFQSACDSEQQTENPSVSREPWGL